MTKKFFLKILFGFLAWKIFCLLVAFLATFFIILNPKFTPMLLFGARLPYLLWVWGNFDGMHYMEIAQNGYHTLENAFFPFYPLLIKTLMLSLNRFFYLNYLLSAQIISGLSLFFALLVIYSITVIDKVKKIFPLLLLIILTFPTSFYYGAVYNDSLFLLLACLTILFSRKKSFLTASIFAFLATLTRLNGLALVFIILFEYASFDWNKKEIKARFFEAFSLKKIKESKVFSVILVPIAFVLYLFYTQLVAGSWTAVFSSMKGWGQDKLILPPQVVFRYFKIIVLNPSFTLPYLIAFFELFSVVFYIFLLIYSWKKIRLSYWLFFAASILIPSLTGTFQGMPRYGLHLFPFFIAITLFLENKNLAVKIIYFTVVLILLIAGISLFTRGYFVA